MRLRIRHGKYSAEFYWLDDAGKRRRELRATGIIADGSAAARKTAEQIARKYEADANGLGGQARARQVRREGPQTLREAYAARVKAKRLAGCSEPAIAIVWNKAVHPLRFFGPDTDPWDVDEDKLRQFAEYARQSRAPATVQRELAELRSVLRAAGIKLMPKFPSVGGVRPRDLWLDHDQFARLLEHVPTNRWPSDRPTRREYLIVYRMLGLRWSELYKLEPRGTLCHVHGTKTRASDRVMALPLQVQEILQRAQVLARERSCTHLFPHWGNNEIDRCLTKAARSAGVVDEHTYVSVNVLRASFCTELVLAGVHTRKIAALMGHSNTRTAEHWYTRLRPDDLHDVVGLLRGYVSTTSQDMLHAVCNMDAQSNIGAGKDSP